MDDRLTPEREAKFRCWAAAGSAPEFELIRELDAVRAERKKMERECDRLIDLAIVDPGANPQVLWKDRAAQLDTALRKYGSHLGPCDKFALRNGACTCGLDAALAASPAREDVG